MTKKLLALLLAAVMMVTMTGAFAADSIDINARLLSIFDMTAAEWYADETSRVMLATCGWMDIILADNLTDSYEETATDAVLSGSVYVAKSGTLLVVLYFADDATILLGFSPTMGSLNVTMHGRFASPAEVMTGMRSEGLVDSYYLLDGWEMIEAYQAILEVVTE